MARLRQFGAEQPKGAAAVGQSPRPAALSRTRTGSISRARIQRRTPIANKADPGLIYRMPRSRRDLLCIAAAMTVWLAERRAAAADKTSQAAAQYQQTPKDGQSCAMCQLFRPPAACQVVAGTISPAGWCKFFALPD
jgi:hypothetical protein